MGFGSTESGAQFPISGFLPLATVPLTILALSLVPSYPGSISEDLLDVGGWPMPVLGVIAVLASVAAGLAVGATIRNGEFPPSIALLPLLVPSGLGVLVTKYALGRSFWSTTHCGPAPYEVVVVGTVAEVMLYQLVPVVFAALGVLCVAAALLPAVQGPGRVARLGYVAALIALSGSFHATALATAGARKAAFSIAASDLGQELSILLPAITRWQELAKIADGLLGVALLLGLGSAIAQGVRGRAATGVLNILFLAALSVVVRGAPVLDERISNDWQLNADVFPGAVRTSIRLAHTLDLGSSGRESPLLRASLKSRLDYGGGPWGLVLAEPTGSTLERTLSILLASDVRRVALLTRVEPLQGVPSPLRAAANLYSVVHEPAPVSLRFEDETPCGSAATWVGAGLEVRADGEALAKWAAQVHPPNIDDTVWGRPCLDLGTVSAMTPADLSRAVRTANAHGRRVVVSVSRKRD